MDFILIFTFLTMAGLPDEQLLIMENLDDREQCLQIAPEAIKTWGSLAGVTMVEVQSMDCMPVGEET